MLVAACGGGESSGPNPPPAGTVNVQDNSFNPSSITVVAGNTVTWDWKGSNAHNVTFEDMQGSSADKSSGTHQRSFAAAGLYRYRCTIHSSNFTSGMSGSVTAQ
ncbi:MAG: plastocyanin/azurin family copper-binding protein [Gemmatimonadota bacterium]|nr:plastocyanin/azurin family copper-binding protein [Gemmatimonadota bacterium]